MSQRTPVSTSAQLSNLSHSLLVWPTPRQRACPWAASCWNPCSVSPSTHCSSRRYWNTHQQTMQTMGTWRMRFSEQRSCADTNRLVGMRCRPLCCWVSHFLPSEVLLPSCHQKPQAPHWAPNVAGLRCMYTIYAPGGFVGKNEAKQGEP